MAALDMDELVAGIRRFCGNPSGIADSLTDPEVTDDDIERDIGWAIREILVELKGKKIKSSYITTVAGQQLYAADNDAGEIVDVHYGGTESSDELFASVINPNVFPSYALSGAELGERSISIINEIQEREFYRFSRFAKTWDVVDGKICLIPVPSASGTKVYYEYVEDTGDISELDDTYTRLIYLKASIFIYKQMIGTRSNTSQVGQTGFQNTINLSDLFALMEANEKEFNREIARVSKRAVG